MFPHKVLRYFWDALSALYGVAVTATAYSQPVVEILTERAVLDCDNIAIRRSDLHGRLQCATLLTPVMYGFYLPLVGADEATTRRRIGQRQL